VNVIYYFCEEFIFRGVLFFGLWDKLKFHTFWIVNILFALLHFTKPLPEVFFAFFVGSAMTYLSFKTKSFLPAVVTHASISLILNFLILYRPL
jgi:membrane protease YdiL (CAAX protease family)